MPSINSLTPQHAVSSYCPTTTPTRARAKYHTVEIKKYINSKCVNKVSCCVVSRLFPEDAAAKKKIPQILTLSLQDKDPVFGLTGTYRLAIYFLNKHKLIFIYGQFIHLAALIFKIIILQSNSDYCTCYISPC